FWMPMAPRASQSTLTGTNVRRERIATVRSSGSLATSMLTGRRIAARSDAWIAAERSAEFDGRLLGRPASSAGAAGAPTPQTTARSSAAGQSLPHISRLRVLRASAVNPFRLRPQPLQPAGAVAEAVGLHAH